MLESLRHELRFRMKAVSVTWHRDVTVGSEITAAELGVPVGTVIRDTVMWHRNPLRQLHWRIKHRDFKNRVQNPSSNPHRAA